MVDEVFIVIASYLKYLAFIPIANYLSIVCNDAICKERGFD